MPKKPTHLDKGLRTMKTFFSLLALFLYFPALYAQNDRTTAASEEMDYHLGFRVAPRVSTLGGGIEVAKGLSPRFGLRGGFNYFSYQYDATEDDVAYDLELELKSFGVFADYHPFKGSFRISGGLLLNGNGLSGKAKPSGSFDIGDKTYTAAEINSINLDVSYNSLAPYLGLGWDTTFGDDEHWGFTFDVGLIYSGAAGVTLGVNHNLTGATASDLETQRQKEQNDLQDELNNLEWWPVLSAGIVYQF